MRQRYYSLPREGGGALSDVCRQRDGRSRKQLPQSRHRPSAERLASVSRGSVRASVRKQHSQCAVSKLENGQSPTGALTRKRFLALKRAPKMRNHYYSLPCARGGVRRGMSLTEGLFCVRNTDFYNPPASHSLGTLPYTGRAEKKHFSPLTQGGQGEELLFSPKESA